MALLNLNIYASNNITVRFIPPKMYICATNTMHQCVHSSKSKIHNKYIWILIILYNKQMNELLLSKHNTLLPYTWI